MAQRRGLYPWLARGCGALGTVQPGLGLALAARLGERAAYSSSTWRSPRIAELRALLPALAPDELQRLRRAITEQEFRNLVLRRLIERRGAAVVVELLGAVDAGPLLRLREAGRPVVIVSWHHGPPWGSAAALRRLGLAGLCPTTRPLLPPGEADGPVRHWCVELGGPDAAFLKEALAELERGGVVSMNLDWREPRGIPVTLLGRRARVAPGAAWLARHAGARLVPATRRWSAGRIEVRFHEPLAEPELPREPARAFEQALLQTAGAWFDAWLRANPETLRVRQLRGLLRSR
jgi:lauroyl/myristoyl acyltransferase